MFISMKCLIKDKHGFWAKGLINSKNFDEERMIEIL